MIYILSGKIETGKSKTLLEWIENRNDVYGILSPTNIHNKRHFLNVETREAFPMQAGSDDKDIISIGRYHFFTDSFYKANEVLLKEAEKRDQGYIIIDELGKLELKSQGLHKAAKAVIDRARKNDKLHVILVIRESLLDAIKVKYGITEFSIFDIMDLTSF